MSAPNTTGQVENLRDSLLPAPASDSGSEDRPRMPFKTSLKLDREQENELVEYGLHKVEDYAEQLGRKFKTSNTPGKGQAVMRARIEQPNSFMGKREKFTLRFYNHVEDRAVPDSIYQHSNLTASLSQRITMQMIASATGFFFGQPDDIDWFSTSAVGAEDETLSDKLKKHARWKVDQCGVKHRFIEGLEFAFIRGEAFVKTTHQERSQIYKRTSTILVKSAGKDGEPILDARGDYICQGDTWVDQMGPAPTAPQPGLIAGAVQKVKQFFTGPEPGSTDGTTPNPAPSGPNGGNGPTQPDGQIQQPPQMVPTGRKVLKRDGVTVMPDNPVWDTRVITRRLVTFEGPEAAVVYYQDFVFPLLGPDLQTADLIAHLYDMDVMQLAQMFRGQYGEGDEAIEEMTEAVERLRELLNESATPKAAAGQARADMRETDATGEVGTPRSEMAECYLTYDADEDGVQEEIMLVVNRASKTPIYYEYLANVTTKGIRPFQVWRPMPVDGRIYGMGAMELFDPEQEFVDLQINRHNFSWSSKGMVTFWDPSATVEGARDPNLKFNFGGTYTKKDSSKKTEDILSFVQLPSDAEALEYLIDLFMQLMQLKSGKINPGDQKMSGLPSSETATGENLITSSGDELFSRLLTHLFPGVKASLAAVLDLIYANMNRPEVFSFFNGEADEILSLNPDEVRDLPLNVTLELSRTQQRKALENGDKSTALINWFYQLPFVLQQRCSAYARQQLKALGVSQADKVIDPIDLSGGQPQSKVSESINYKDARPSIKAQIEQQAGLDPNAPAPAAMEAAQTEHDQTVNPPKTEPAKSPSPAI